jgi:hypothetical protein
MVLLLAGVGLYAAQNKGTTDPLATFSARINEYVEIHRRVEGPVPPLEASKDMEEVQRLMKLLRARIMAERPGRASGYLFTAPVMTALRQRIASRLTRKDIADIIADVDEQTPPGSVKVRVNDPLPLDASFIPIPPKLFEELPPLPKELRYLILAKALVVWDQHVNLVVDLGPRLFDPKTYPGTGSLGS